MCSKINVAMSDGIYLLLFYSRCCNYSHQFTKIFSLDTGKRQERQKNLIIHMMMMYEMISCLKDYVKIRNEYCFKSEMNIVPYFAKIHIVICYWSLLVRDASSTSAPQYHQQIGPVTKDIIFYNKWHIFVLTYDMHFLTRAFDLKRHIYITCYKCDHLYHAKCTFFQTHTSL